MHVLLRLIQAPLVFGLCLGLYRLATYIGPTPPTEIAPGVLVSVERLVPTPTGSGRMFLARIRLDPTLLDLFITPADPALAGTGFTHRLAHVDSAARANRLAVAINASLFAGEGFPFPRGGLRALPVDTTVVHGDILNYWEHSFMLGMLPGLVADPIPEKHIPPARMAGWRWGIGVQTWLRFDSQERHPRDPTTDHRTFIGLCPESRELMLAVFENATPHRAADELLARGAAHAGNLDGGNSSTFVVGGAAWFGNWRPVPNLVGIQSKPRS